MLNLQRIRLLLELNQTEMAEKLGTNRVTYQRWEKGHTSVSDMYKTKVERILAEDALNYGVNPEDIFKEEMKSPTYWNPTPPSKPSENKSYAPKIGTVSYALFPTEDTLEERLAKVNNIIKNLDVALIKSELKYTQAEIEREDKKIYDRDSWSIGCCKWDIDLINLLLGTHKKMNANYEDIDTEYTHSRKDSRKYYENLKYMIIHLGAPDMSVTENIELLREELEVEQDENKRKELLDRRDFLISIIHLYEKRHWLAYAKQR